MQCNQPHIHILFLLGRTDTGDRCIWAQLCTSLVILSTMHSFSTIPPADGSPPKLVGTACHCISAQSSVPDCRWRQSVPDHSVYITPSPCRFTGCEVCISMGRDLTVYDHNQASLTLARWQVIWFNAIRIWGARLLQIRRRSLLFQSSQLYNWRILLTQEGTLALFLSTSQSSTTLSVSLHEARHYGSSQGYDGVGSLSTTVVQTMHCFSTIASPKMNQSADYSNWHHNRKVKKGNKVFEFGAGFFMMKPS